MRQGIDHDPYDLRGHLRAAHDALTRVLSGTREGEAFHDAVRAYVAHTVLAALGGNRPLGRPADAHFRDVVRDVDARGNLRGRHVPNPTA